MAVLTVGPGKQFPTIAGAVAQSRDGDVIQVQAGVYTDDFFQVDHSVTITAMGGPAKLVASQPIPNGKAIIVGNGDLTVVGLEFKGASVPDLNGAGIRMQAGNLTVKDCRFHDNQMHILTNGYAGGEVVITGSEFGYTTPSSALSHGVYIHRIHKAVIKDSYFHDISNGHQIKTRAEQCEISGNRIADGAGQASYSVDMPNGGSCVVKDNVMVQGANGGNPSFVHFGGEGSEHSVNSLTVSGNLFINEKPSGNGIAVYNQTPATAVVTGNKFYRVNEPTLGRAAAEGNSVLTGKPKLDGRHMVIGQAEAPQSVGDLAGELVVPGLGVAFAVLGVVALRKRRG